MNNTLDRQVDINGVVNKLLQQNSELTLQNALQQCHIENLERQLREKSENAKEEK